MLKILKGQENVSTGVVICEESKNGSAMPFVLHFLATAAESNQTVAIFSSKFAELNYRHITSKAGVRWIPNQTLFFEMIERNSLFEVEAQSIMKNIHDKVVETNPSFVIFDDLSCLENLGAKPTEVAIFINKIYTTLKTNHQNPLIFCPFPNPSKALNLLKNRSDLHIQISPVGHGFGKDASAKTVLSIKKFNEPTTKKAILLSGERTNNGTWVSCDS